MALTTVLITDVTTTTQSRINTLATYGAVGDDNTAAVPSDTALASEVFRKVRSDVDVSSPGVIILTMEITTAEANGNDLKEFGWFDAASSGNMYVRDILTSITKTSDINLYLDTSVTIVVEEV